MAVRVLVTGLSHFARALAIRLDQSGGGVEAFYAEYAPRRWFQFFFAALRVDVLYFVNGWPSFGARSRFLLRLLVFLRKRIVYHWVGSDVLSLEKGMPVLSGRGLCHLSESDWMRDELRAKGLETEVLPLLGVSVPAETTPFPEVFTVLSYAGQGREDFYGLPLLVRLAEEFPDVRFRVMGTTGAGRRFPENMALLGWVDPVPEYRNCVLYLRIVPHDGLSVSVLEALAQGRYVGYSMPLAGCCRAGGLKETRKCLLRLQSDHSAGQLAFNDIGVDFVRACYGREEVVKWQVGLLKDLAVKR